MQAQRIRNRNNKPIQQRGFVLYWMQASQRAEWNHALEYAILQANKRIKPVLAAFSLTDDFPEANQRHYAFMLQGLRETQAALAERHIQLVILRGNPVKTIPQLARQADMLVMDDGYLRCQRQWRDSIALSADCLACEVAANLIVPAEEASDKENFSARTFRPRIHKQLPQYLIPLQHSKPRCSSLNLQFSSYDISNTEQTLKQLNIDHSIAPSIFYTGGTSQAKQRLRKFIQEKLDAYPDHRSDPLQNCQSHLSPYLHFGQISPLYIALEILKTDSPGKDSFLEELIVRRELSHNFVYYNRRYDQFDALPHWALRTLKLHAKDKRLSIYSLDEFEHARTHDPFWNAAQTEMALTGKMHNYMRMYWGKKIIEWSRTPEEAYHIALHLNNKYQLDGRDPNSFAGIAWCFGKHDRPWGRHPVFGTVRYMNAAGLKRKFNPAAYADTISNLRLAEKQCR